MISNVTQKAISGFVIEVLIYSDITKMAPNGYVKSSIKNLYFLSCKLKLPKNKPQTSSFYFKISIIWLFK